jgi:hypothetical protein
MPIRGGIGSVSDFERGAQSLGQEAFGTVVILEVVGYREV